MSLHAAFERKYTRSWISIPTNTDAGQVFSKLFQFRDGPFCFGKHV